MEKSSRTGWLFAVGVPLLIVGLGFETVTVATQSLHSYRLVLIAALVLTAVADFCFVLAFRRGRIAARVFSVLLLLPTLFVLADFARRAPATFR